MVKMVLFPWRDGEEIMPIHTGAIYFPWKIPVNYGGNVPISGYGSYFGGVCEGLGGVSSNCGGGLSEGLGGKLSSWGGVAV